MRLSSRPPSSAPSRAAMKVVEEGAGSSPAGVAAAPLLAALAVSAACSAGDTSARAAAPAGQAPVTGASARQATGWPACRSASASATTTGIVVGLALRWSANGIVAVQVPPCQDWVQSLPETAAVRITSGSRGRSPASCPERRPAGLRAAPSGCGRRLRWCRAWPAAGAGPPRRCRNRPCAARSSLAAAGPA